MIGKLDGKTAWISGAASGIGEATAKLLSAEGACVAIIDVQGEAGKRVGKEINDVGGRALFIECDVSKEDQIRASIEQTLQQFDSLQIVVNCAGVTRFKPLHEFTEEEWDRVLGTNLKSMFFSVKHAIPSLRKNKRSYVVNIASISSFIGDKGEGVYTASKGGVLLLTKSIALDYAADGLRCNCVCPGITDTPMLRYHLSLTNDPEGTLAQRLRRVPMGVVVTPQDIAKAVLYCSCEDSSGMTGALRRRAARPDLRPFDESTSRRLGRRPYPMRDSCS